MTQARWLVGALAVALALVTPAAVAQCPANDADTDFIAHNTSHSVLGAFHAANANNILNAAGDTIPDMMQTAPVQFLVRGSSQFFNAAACATFDANRTAFNAALNASGIFNLVPGRTYDAALICVDHTVAVPNIQTAFRAAVPAFTINVANFASITNLRAGDDRDADGETLQQEWNNLGATFVPGTPIGGNWQLPGGAPSNAAVFAAYGVAALAGANPTVNISGPSILFGGTTGTYTASTSVPSSFSGANDTQHTMQSSNTSVLLLTNITSVGNSTTAIGNPGQVGTATVTATGNNTGASASLTVQVKNPAWFEVCALNGIFKSAYSGLAAINLGTFTLGCLMTNGAGIGTTGTDKPNRMNIDGTNSILLPGGPADPGAADVHQLALLAYTLCKDGRLFTDPLAGRPFKAEPPNAGPVVEMYLRNLDRVRDYFQDLNEGTTLANTENVGFPPATDPLGTANSLKALNDFLAPNDFNLTIGGTSTLTVGGAAGGATSTLVQSQENTTAITHTVSWSTNSSRLIVDANTGSISINPAYIPLTNESTATIRARVLTNAALNFPAGSGFTNVTANQAAGIEATRTITIVDNSIPKISITPSGSSSNPYRLALRLTPLVDDPNTPFVPAPTDKQEVLLVASSTNSNDTGFVWASSGTPVAVIPVRIADPGDANPAGAFVPMPAGTPTLRAIARADGSGTVTVTATSTFDPPGPAGPQSATTTIRVIDFAAFNADCNFPTQPLNLNTKEGEGDDEKAASGDGPAGKWRRVDQAFNKLDADRPTGVVDDLIDVISAGHAVAASAVLAGHIAINTAEAKFVSDAGAAWKYDASTGALSNAAGAAGTALSALGFVDSTPLSSDNAAIGSRSVSTMISTVSSALSQISTARSIGGTKSLQEMYAGLAGISGRLRLWVTLWLQGTLLATQTPSTFAGNAAQSANIVAAQSARLATLEALVGSDFATAGYPNLAAYKQALDIGTNPQLNLTTAPAPGTTFPGTFVNNQVFQLYNRDDDAIDKAPADLIFSGPVVYSPGIHGTADLSGPGKPFVPGTSDITNANASLLVQAAGGDEIDFVGIVTGDNLFADGSPFLPAAGALGLGLLAGALAFGGAMRLRRRHA